MKIGDWLKTNSKAVNDYAVTAAIVLGGIWGFYKFQIADSPDAIFANSERTRLCAQNGSLDIHIDAQQDEKVVYGKIVVKNIGTLPVRLDMNTEPVNFKEMTSAQNGFNSSEAIPTHYGLPLTIFSILPGRTVEFPFIEDVPHEGFYLIAFNGGERHVDPAYEGCDASKKKGKQDPPSPQYYWSAATIVRVKQAVEN